MNIKKFGLFIFLSGFFAFAFGCGLASGQTEDAPSSFLAPIEVKNIDVIINQHIISGSFTLKNRQEKAVPGLNWIMTLQEEPERRADKSWTSKPPAELFEPSQQESNIALSPGEEKNINFSFNFSSLIKSSRYDLFVSVVDATGGILGGGVYSGITLKGSGEALDISRACLLANEGLKLDCEISNPSDKALTFYPTLVLAKSNSKEKTPPQTLSSFVVEAKETKTFTFYFTAPAEEGAYNGTLRLLNEKKEALSNYAFFDYAAPAEKEIPLSAAGKGVFSKVKNASLVILIIIVIFLIVSAVLRKKNLKKYKFFILILFPFIFGFVFQINVKGVQASDNSNGDTKIHTHIFHDDVDKLKIDPEKWGQSELKNVSIQNVRYESGQRAFLFDASFVQTNHNYSRMASILKIGYALRRADSAGYVPVRNPSPVDGSLSSVDSGGLTMEYQNSLGLWKIGGLSEGEKYSGDKNISIYNLKVPVPIFLLDEPDEDINQVRLFLDFRLVAVPAISDELGYYTTSRYFSATSDYNQGASEGGFYFLKKDFDSENKMTKGWFSFLSEDYDKDGDSNYEDLFKRSWCDTTDTVCPYVRKTRGIGKYALPLITDPFASDPSVLLVSAGPFRTMSYDSAGTKTIKLNGWVSGLPAGTSIKATWTCTAKSVSSISQSTIQSAVDVNGDPIRQTVSFNYTPQPGLTEVTKAWCDLKAEGVVGGETIKAKTLTRVIIEPPTNRITANGYVDSYFVPQRNSPATLEWETTGYNTCKIVVSSRRSSLSGSLPQIYSKSGKAANGLSDTFNLPYYAASGGKIGTASFIYGLVCKETKASPWTVIDSVVITALDTNAFCSGSPAENAIGQTITWTAVPKTVGNDFSNDPAVINDLDYLWSGDEGLSGNTKEVTKEYESAGTKSATVKISPFSQPSISQTASCTVDIETLKVTLTAQPDNGPISVTSTLSATAEGTASGLYYKYYFWWNCDNANTVLDDVKAACGNPDFFETIGTGLAGAGYSKKTAITPSHTYTAGAGPITIYKPKVIVERDFALPQTAAATVTVTPPTLKVQVVGAGKVDSENVAGISECRQLSGDCNEMYAVDTEVNLTATPDNSEVAFVGWSGDLDCSDGSVKMNGNRTCIATFNTSPAADAGPSHLNLIVGTSHPHSGLATDPDSAGRNLKSYQWLFTSCIPGPCPSGTGVMSIDGTSATPSFTYTPSVAGTYTLKLIVTDDMDETDEATITEEALLPTFDLGVTIIGSGSGSVTSNVNGINCPGDCDNAYDDGTLVTLTATPDSGASFVGWSGDAASCDIATTCGLTMNVDKSVTATFDASPPVPSYWWNLFRTLWKEKK